MVRVSSPAKLRPWSKFTAKMVLGVVPGLVKIRAAENRGLLLIQTLFFKLRLWRVQDPQKTAVFSHKAKIRAANVPQKK